MPVALVRRPGPRLAEGLVTHRSRVPIDIATAFEQWQQYVDAMGANGWTIVEVPPADECPDAVFVEDAVVVFDDVAVLARPGAPSRRPELAGADRAAREAGLAIERIEAPATLDGGDVLKVGRTVHVGVGSRTSRGGVDQLAELLSPRGWQVVPVAVERVLHLKSAVTALPDGTIIGFPDHIDDPAVFERFEAMPEAEGAHVVLLGDDRLLMSASAPASAEAVRAMGYEPVIVDISEFEKLEGCVTCLSVRIRRG